MPGSFRQVLTLSMWVLYLHGSAYMLGSLKSHRDLIARLSNAAGFRSLYADYRLAPEHVFPAALDDTLTSYSWLLHEHETRPEHVVLAGDSSGGGLTLALLQMLRGRKFPMPAAAVLLSPWTDLEGAVESRKTREAFDPVFTAKGINSLAGLYAGGTDLRNLLILPVNADLHGFPPLHIDVGSDKVLLDDSLLIAEHAKSAQVLVELKMWQQMWHFFQLFSSVLPEGRDSLNKMGEFVRQHTRLSG